MTIETKFDVGQEVFWHNVREEKVERSIIDTIKTEIWKGMTEMNISFIYRLMPQRCWVSDFHLFADESSAVAEMEKWKKL
jgi:hypothetical protein